VIASAQTTATTTPAGFITVNFPAAPSASTPSLTALSVPLYKPADFTGGVGTIDSANQFTLTGAAWTPGAFASATAPRLVRIKSGSGTGKFFVVTGNTNNQLTVDLTGTGVANINTVVSTSPSTQCEVLPANTLGNVFGTGATPPTLKPGATANDGDNVLLWNGSGWDTYFWTGVVGTPNNIWKRSGTIDRSNVIIYPDDGVFVVRRETASATSVTLLGTVPSTSEQSGIPSGSTFLGNRFPIDTTLGGLGLQNIPGWDAGVTSSDADNVLILNVSGGWDTYFWTGTEGSPNNIWKRSGTIDRSSTPIPAGTAVFITHPGGAVTLTQSLPYTP
jgi:uncharacterized protein (TIGR02597 family)